MLPRSVIGKERELKGYDGLPARASSPLATAEPVTGILVQYHEPSSVAVQEATVLSRAVKEHERRRGEKEGFSKAPGDCLAFKYYRDVRLIWARNTP